MNHNINKSFERLLGENNGYSDWTRTLPFSGRLATSTGDTSDIQNIPIRKKISEKHAADSIRNRQDSIFKLQSHLPMTDIGKQFEKLVAYTFVRHRGCILERSGGGYKY